MNGRIKLYRQSMHSGRVPESNSLASGEMMEHVLDLSKATFEISKFLKQFGFAVFPIRNFLHKSFDDWKTTLPDEPYLWDNSTGIAVALGRGNHYAIDIDQCKDIGLVTKLLEELGLPRGYLWTVKSPGGYHIHFGSEHDLPNNLVWESPDNLFGQIELKGAGSKITMPPTESKEPGHEGYYKWQFRDEPFKPPDILSPEAVMTGLSKVGVLRKPQSLNTGTNGDIKTANNFPFLDGTVKKGSRHKEAVRSASHLKSHGISKSEALQIMLNANKTLEEPLLEKEVNDTVNDIYRRYADTNNEGTNGKRSVYLTRASEITPKPVHWLWQGRIPLGALSLLAGREGIGKSTVAFWEIASLTRGTLDGKFKNNPRAVIIGATEDSWEHTIVPRLIAADADLDLVFRCEVRTSDNVDTALSLPRDLAGLENRIREVNAAMILLDPLVSRLESSLDMHKDSDVRRALEPLVKLADETDAAVIGIIHVNKSGSTDPLTQVMGSRAFAAVARAVLFVASDPEDEKVRLLGQPKNNLGSLDLPTLKFRIVQYTIPDTREDAIVTGRIEWLGESSRSINDVVAMQGISRQERDAADWLSEYLAGRGEVDFNEVIKAANQAGYSQRAIQRASKKLHVQIERKGFPSQTTWSLSGAKPPWETYN